MRLFLEIGANMAFYGFLAVGAIVVGATLLLLSLYFPLWLQARVSGVRVGMLTLMGMSLRNVDPRVIVQAQVMAVQAGIAGVSTNAAEALYLAGGNVPRIMLALIAAQRAGIELDWNTAAAVDLAGRDILEAVQVSVTPKVIFCPTLADGIDATIDGVARDGIQLKVRVVVTVRTNLAQLVGGAAELTVIARVGQGIVSAIGACESYRDALADPALISRRVTQDHLDSQTSYAIVSIDIATIQVGENIGALLQFQQADADIRIARAGAESRRAMAIAQQQEMVVRTREQEAGVVRAESQIPRAMGGAIEAGRLLVKPPVVRRASRRTDIPWERTQLAWSAPAPAVAVAVPGQVVRKEYRRSDE